MSSIFTWLYKRKDLSVATTISRTASIESLIVHKQIKEFTSYLQKKDYRPLCIDGFFHLLPTIPDESYMTNLFELITTKSGLPLAELSKTLVSKLSRAILDEDFDFCEKILHLPFRSMSILLPTYELTRFIHSCPNKFQVIKCLSILIEKNLPYDPEYFSWILIILFEHYKIGDEMIIEYLLNLKKDINLLFTCYGNNHVTPLMLFFHLYSNNKCQTLIDHHFSTINDQSKLLACDRWNRSCLMHLLCGHCEHQGEGISSTIATTDISEMNKELFCHCPHASAILSKFAMLYKLGNRCDTPVRTIFTSQYCLPLRMILFNYLLENDSLLEVKLDELFVNFPAQYIYMYSNYLKQLVQNRNLNDVLVSVMLSRRNNDDSLENTIKFLLQQGARIENTSQVQSTITSLLSFSRSMIPFILLDYSVYIDIKFSQWAGRSDPRMELYVCRVLQCGYPSEFRIRFEEFKSRLSPLTVQCIEKFIDLKNPSTLSKLCLQKLRSSLKNLGEHTEDQLKNYLSTRLRLSIRLFGYNECITYYQSVVRS